MTKKLPKLAKRISAELAYILGVVNGDGYLYRNKNSYEIRLKAKDKDFVLTFKENFEKWSGFKMWFTNSLGYHLVIAQSKEAYYFLKTFNLDTFLLVDNISKKLFLRGLFDSDGGAYFNGEYSRKVVFANTNKYLLGLISKLLNQLNIQHSIYENKRKRDYYLPLFTIEIKGKEDFEKFHENVGFSILRKQTTLNEILNSYVEARFTRKEKKFIKENHFLLSDEKIAGKLNRSKQSIQHKRVRMGFKKSLLRPRNSLGRFMK